MIICPYCKSENRSGARYCKNCASLLPETAAKTIPIKLKNSSATIRLETAGSRKSQSSHTDTQPLNEQLAFIQRPPGAIFNNLYIYQELIFSNDQQQQYSVIQANNNEDKQIRVCPNPACGAFFPPGSEQPEKFCTDCGTIIEPFLKDLVITETLKPVSEQKVHIVKMGLSHGSVRAPLDVFVEQVAGNLRYCLLSVPVESLDCTPTSLQALRWGVDLSRGLDYLHDNGITFQGQIDSTCFGLAGERMVWFNFFRGVLHPDGYVSDRKADVQALANFIYLCLTGKNQFEAESNLTSVVNLAFQQALSTPGPENGQELSEIFQQALSQSIVTHDVDFQVGRRTHVGMARKLNEDSLLTLEMSCIQQSINHPLGVFVVADGMGGHSGGELASGTIVSEIAEKAIQELFQTERLHNKNNNRDGWLLKVVETVHKDVYELRNSAGTDMGSTLVAMVLENSKAYIAHVGDSRAYLINSQGIKQLTTDHSLVERLIASQQITREEARTHPQRNVIYRTIGDKAKVEVDIQTFDLKVNEMVLLCSDGLCGMITDQVINTIVQEASCPQTACEALVKAANAAGGDDNISVVLVRLVGIGDG